MLAREIMQLLYRGDIYQGYVPGFPEDLQGWNSQAPALTRAIEDVGACIIFDVGVWKGASTIFLAEALRDRGVPGAVIAVDTFLGSAEHWVLKPDAPNPYRRRHGLPVLYDQFLSNVVRRRLQDYVVPMPQTSETAAAILHAAGVRAGIIHIDAAHDYASVLRDARAYWELLAPEGWLIGDDYHPTWPGVVQAADEFAVEVGRPLEADPPKWIVRKPGEGRE